MPTYLKKIVWALGIFLLLVSIALFVLSRKESPTTITYGLSFNEPYALELGLEPRVVLDALIHDLGVRHFRFAAHWPLIEPTEGVYQFAWMDEHLAAVEAVDGSVIFGVGRRLPRWPECHIPDWARELSWEEQKREIREYIEVVVTRYKDSPAITHWQVENEPYLEVFAHQHCGDLDEDFLKEEIALVQELDPTRPILLTDSGNLGTWRGAFKNGDSFGTSVYVYFWNPELGQFKTVLPPWFYRVKENFFSLIYGPRETFLIELSAEPWLLEPITDVPLSVQYARMDVDKFGEIIAYAKKTRFDQQYLWGGEWWYWLKEQGESAMWEQARVLYK